MENPLDRTIEKLGSQTALALKLGIKPQAVQQWEFIPESRALEVEKIMDGEVSAINILEYAAWVQRKRARTQRRKAA